MAMDTGVYCFLPAFFKVHSNEPECGYLPQNTA
jgi:hypothetical protein